MKFASGILPISQSTKEICIAWRSANIRQGNCWSVIGGMWTPGMTLQESALRELREETGYNGQITLSPSYILKRPGFEYHNFIGIVPEVFLLQPDPKFDFEVESIEWLKLKELYSLVEELPNMFHHGFIDLLNNSGNLVEKLLVCC